MECHNLCVVHLYVQFHVTVGMTEGKKAVELSSLLMTIAIQFSWQCNRKDLPWSSFRMPFFINKKPCTYNQIYVIIPVAQLNLSFIQINSCI